MSKQEITCPHCHQIFEVDDTSYNNIVAQIRNHEFDSEVEKRLHDATRAIRLEAERDFQDTIHAKEAEVVQLNAALDKAQTVAESKIEQYKATTDAELAKMAAEVAQKESEKQQIKENYELRLRDMNDAIERLKDMKLKLSTKAIGESLEQFCQDEFNKIRATAFPHAYFEKDNEVSKASNSKGDFIFRDPADGVESISIMFDMKNESQTTKTKHKNEDFLAELDKDRREKNCEYAVLVSMLEADSELYNQGIVDVSYKYPKMYVIRPQFFIPLITILKNAAEKSLAVKQELALARSQNVDITNFENDLNEWKDSWATNIKNAAKKHGDAIAQIDKAIADLQKVRDALTTSDKHLLAAENKMDKLTIKRLTAKNPTMREKFENLNKDEQA